MGQQISDKERINIFMDSFHFVSEKDFWRQLRNETRPNRLSNLEIIINERGEVDLKRVPLPDSLVHIASANFRKFISGGDEVYLGHVLSAAKRLHYKDESVDEAQNQFDQLTARSMKFKVHEGRSVAIVIGKEQVRWEQHLNFNLDECEEENLSLKDFSEILFNEGMFHPFIPGFNENRRSVARSVANPLRTALQNVCLAGTIYAALLLHGALAKRVNLSCTPEKCTEQKILDEHLKQWQERHSE